MVYSCEKIDGLDFDIAAGREASLVAEVSRSGDRRL
jgi:hypothetical protein